MQASKKQLSCAAPRRAAHAFRAATPHRHGGAADAAQPTHKTERMVTSQLEGQPGSHEEAQAPGGRRCSWWRRRRDGQERFALKDRRGASGLASLLSTGQHPRAHGQTHLDHLPLTFILNNHPTPPHAGPLLADLMPEELAPIPENRQSTEGAGTSQGAASSGGGRAGAAARRAVQLLRRRPAAGREVAADGDTSMGEVGCWRRLRLVTASCCCPGGSVFGC
jgi:hypothetical protein